MPPRPRGEGGRDRKGGRERPFRRRGLYGAYALVGGFRDYPLTHDLQNERRCITSRSIYRRLAAAGRNMALRGGKRYCRRLVRRQLCHIARNMTWWCSAAVGQEESPGRLRRRGSDRRSSNGGMSQDLALASRACRARI